MSAIQSVVVNSVWVIALAALLATLSYMDWYRTVRKWTWRETFQRPVALVPFNGSLTCFCGGLLLSEVYFNPITFQRANFGAVGQLLIWAILAIYFCYQLAQTIRYGRRHGWDNPIGSQ